MRLQPERDYDDAGVRLFDLLVDVADSPDPVPWSQRDLADVHALIDDGAPADVPYGYAGRTSMHLLVRLGEHALLETALDRGNLPHRADRDGETPATLAAKLDEPGMCLLLMRHGAPRCRRVVDRLTAHAGRHSQEMAQAPDGPEREERKACTADIDEALRDSAALPPDHAMRCSARRPSRALRIATFHQRHQAHQASIEAKADQAARTLGYADPAGRLYFGQAAMGR